MDNASIPKKDTFSCAEVLEVSPHTENSLGRLKDQRNLPCTSQASAPSDSTNDKWEPFELNCV